MAANMLLQRAAMRSLLQASTRSQPAILRHTMCLHMQARFASDAPHPQTIMDTGFWKSLVPKPLRKENRQARAKKNKKKGEWNPVTFYIIMFLFIGSMSIQMIALRNSTDRYKRQATVRIAQLKEIVERIQNGEDVDVEKLLGTGEPQRETDWEEGMYHGCERMDGKANVLGSFTSN